MKGLQRVHSWQSVGEQIQDNHHLNRVLMSVPDVRREVFYMMIRPYLKFEPKPQFSFSREDRA